MRMTTIRFLMGVLAVSLAVPALAQDESPPPDPNWTGSLGLAYLATSGNTDTRTFGLDFSMERKPTPWGLEISAAFNRAEENSELTAERYLVGGRARRALGDRLELFAGLSGEKDEFSGFDLRTVVETGATYKALLGPRHLLSFDLGLTWTDEDRTEPAPAVSYVGGVAGLAYEWKLSDNASLTERLLYYPNFDESNDWRMSSETALQASLTNRLALKLGYEVRYRNRPIGDNEDTDTATKVSVVAKF